MKRATKRKSKSLIAAADELPVKVIKKNDEEEDSGLEMPASEKPTDDEEEVAAIVKENGEAAAATPTKKEAKKKKQKASAAMSGELKALRDIMAEESAFAAKIMRTMVIPKHKTGDDSDDDDEEDMDVSSLTETQRQKLFGSKGNRAGSLQELQQRYKERMADLKGNREDGRKKKKGKLSKVEKKKMMRDAKKKLITAGKLHLREQQQALQKGKGAKGPGRKKVFNEEGKMVFSKFDFTAPDEGAGKKKPNLDPKSALAKLNAQKEKIKSLEAIGMKRSSNQWNQRFNNT